MFARIYLPARAKLSLPLYQRSYYAYETADSLDKGAILHIMNML